MKRSRNKSRNKIDEHEQPTEPMAIMEIAPFATTVDAAVSSVHQEREASRPRLSVAGRQPPLYSPVTRAYPYLPSAPLIYTKKGRTYTARGKARTQAADMPRRANRRRGRRRWLPELLGVSCVAIQFVLLIRFLLKLIGMRGDWISSIYTLSEPLVLPFQRLLQHIALPRPADVEVEALVAILVYGLFSRLAVRILRSALNTD